MGLAYKTDRGTIIFCEISLPNSSNVSKVTRVGTNARALINPITTTGYTDFAYFTNGAYLKYDRFMSDRFAMGVFPPSGANINGNITAFSDITKVGFYFYYCPENPSLGWNFAMTQNDNYWTVGTTLNPTFLSFSNGTFTGAQTVEVFPGYESEVGGGDGDFTNVEDEVGFPELPVVSPINSDMVSLYNPSLSQVSSLSSFLWTPTFYDSIVKLFQSPMEALIGLMLFPTSPDTSGTEEIHVGLIGTGVSAPRVNNQFGVVDCGSITIKEYWGNALDYTPYTKISIYLPFIGVKTLNTDEVMGATLHVKYHIDFLTGMCVCFIKVTKTGVSAVLYNFSGNVATQIPLSGTNMSQIMTTVTSIAATIGTAVATGGASAIATVAAGTAMNVVNSKMHVERSGRMDSVAGFMGIKKPYIILNRPVQSLAGFYNNFKGYPSNITAKLNTLSGYTEVDEIKLTNINATETEIKEIEKLLKEGVFL